MKLYLLLTQIGFGLLLSLAVNTITPYTLYIKLVLVGGDEAHLGGQVGSSQLHFDVQFFIAFKHTHDNDSVDLDFELTSQQKLELQVRTNGIQKTIMTRFFSSRMYMVVTQC